MNNMTTILEVAKRAGVSKATVSRVPSGDDYVSQKIRDHVLQTIEESGYRLNLLACSLTARITQTLGLVVANTLYHGVHFSELLFHTARMAGDKGRRLLLADGKHSAKEERQAIQYLLDPRCDAIMIHPRFLGVDEIDDIIDAHSQPIAVLNQRLRKNSGHSVWCDRKQTSSNTITQLIAAGHKEIGFITGSMDLPTGVERLSGYKDVLVRHGIALNNDLVVKGRWTLACGAAGVDTLFSREVNFTVLVASNDDMAVGAMKQLHEHDVSVPAQVSVIGFDDIALAPYTIPALSNVKIPVTEMIRETVGRLIFMLGDGAFAPSKTFTSELIACNSIASPVSRWRLSFVAVTNDDGTPFLRSLE